MNRNNNGNGKSKPSQGIGYSNIAKSYDRLYRDEQMAKVAAIRRHFKPSKGDVILDLGCGTGLASSKFLCRIIGLDNSMAMLRLAKGIDRVCGTAETLPFKAKSFDAVICLTAIHNFNSPKEAIEEMLRVSNQQVISVLKRSKDYKGIVNLIRNLLLLEHEIETEKDTIFITGFQVSSK